MKKIMWCWVPVLFSFTASAQSDQIKEYLKQIVSNADFILQMKKGISIAKEGLATIGDIKNGEFNLHKVFINGLSSTNPKIKDWSKVGNIIDYQVNIIKSYKAAYTQIKVSGQFSDAEINYFYGVFGKLIDNCTNIIEMLTDVLADGNFKMSDDERIKRIDALYANMQSNYKFCQQFSNNNIVLAIQRAQERHETASSKKLFDIH